MEETKNNPFAQIPVRKKDPNRKSRITQAIEAGEEAAKLSRYLEDTIAILNNNQYENLNPDELRALMNETRERLIYYRNSNFD